MIFTRTAQQESVHKTFHQSIGRNGNSAVARYLINKTLKTCSDTDIPYFVVDQFQQRGTHFGDRLKSAFDIIFNKGFKNVIAIGNDCPELNSNDLQQAERVLHSGNNVLGPAFDGGAYLIGISKKEFTQGILDSIDWNGAHVSRQLSMASLGKTEVLTAKFDIDTQLTRKVIQTLKDTLCPLWTIILSFLHRLLDDSYIIVRPRLQTSDSQLRGPPTSLIFN